MDWSLAIGVVLIIVIIGALIYVAAVYGGADDSTPQPGPDTPETRAREWL